MQDLEAELERARGLDEGDLADAIEAIGFECTRCGACCKSEADDPHTATVFPDEVRALQAAGGGDGEDDQDGGDDGDSEDDQDGGDDGDSEDGQNGGDSEDGQNGGDSEDDGEYDWRDVARPMPYGLDEDGEGETFEWALQTDACGDCAFYEEDDDGTGACSVHDSRPLICETYPFSVALGGTSQPMGEAVDESGMVRAHECEGLGRDISRADAEALAAALKERAVRELEEAIAVRDEFAPADPDAGAVVVHDSEGAKRPDGTRYDG